MSTIQAAWKDGKCPIRNGIYFGEGAVVLVELVEDEKSKDGCLGKFISKRN